MNKNPNGWHPTKLGELVDLKTGLLGRSTRVQRLLQRVEHELGVHRTALAGSRRCAG
jgi:hypothetical protein